MKKNNKLNVQFAHIDKKIKKYPRIRIKNIYSISNWKKKIKTMKIYSCVRYVSQLNFQAVFQCL